MYRAWGSALPENVEVCAITLPGRETLLRETPVPALTVLVDRILNHIRPALDRPFAIFGHSFGAWLGFELTRALRRTDGPLPTVLFASARRAPTLLANEQPMHGLDDASLLSEIQSRYGGIPPVVLREPELLALLLPALRADLTALETYTFNAEPPLPCPIVSYGGSADTLVPLQDLEAWRTLTAGEFEVRQFPGGHFYLQERSSADLLADVESKLRTLPRVASAL